MRIEFASRANHAATATSAAIRTSATERRGPRMGAHASGGRQYGAAQVSAAAPTSRTRLLTALARRQKLVRHRTACRRYNRRPFLPGSGVLDMRRAQILVLAFLAACEGPTVN